MNKNNKEKTNGPGYKNPTANEAINRVSDEEERFHKLLNMIFTLNRTFRLINTLYNET